MYKLGCLSTDPSNVLQCIASSLSPPQFGPHPLLCVIRVQHWDLNEMGYVETMFGHQSEINALDSWRKERIVTGGRDRTVRQGDGCSSVYDAVRVLMMTWRSFDKIVYATLVNV